MAKPVPPKPVPVPAKAATQPDPVAAAITAVQSLDPVDSEPQPGLERELAPMNVDALARHLADQAIIFVNANGMQHSWPRYRSAIGRTLTHIKISWPKREEMV